MKKVSSILSSVVLTAMTLSSCSENSNLINEIFYYEFKEVESLYKNCMNNPCYGDSVFYTAWYTGLKAEQDNNTPHAIENYLIALNFPRFELSTYEVKLSLGRAEIIRGNIDIGIKYLLEFISEAKAVINNDGESMWGLTEIGEKVLIHKILFARRLIEWNSLTNEELAAIKEEVQKEGLTIIEEATSKVESVFNSITIGKQVWMSENLNVDKFRNGDPIPEAKTNEEWKKAGEKGEPAWCYYNNNPENGGRYGKLYNWFAVNDPRGLAPEGWKIPSDEDWTRLTDFLGGERFAGKKMKSISGWRHDGNGTNESGFSGLPGGSRNYGGSFFNIGEDGGWWSSTEASTYTAWYRYLYYYDGSVGRNGSTKEKGLSVRCLRD